jgi:hypothetical protein
MSTSLLPIYICTVQITISEAELLGYVYIITPHRNDVDISQQFFLGDSYLYSTYIDGEE